MSNLEEIINAAAEVRLRELLSMAVHEDCFFTMVSLRVKAIFAEELAKREPELRQQIIAGLEKMNLRHIRLDSYLCIDGPKKGDS